MIEGYLASEKQYNRIKKLLENALSNPEVQSWFSGEYKLYNESTILINGDEKKTRRPDRVMIKDNKAIVVDYKFARENDEHDKQVKRYMQLLQQMGYTDVTGYLWYIKNDENYTKEISI